MNARRVLLFGFPMLVSVMLLLLFALEEWRMSKITNENFMLISCGMGDRTVYSLIGSSDEQKPMERDGEFVAREFWYSDQVNIMVDFDEGRHVVKAWRWFDPGAKPSLLKRFAAKFGLI